MRCFFLTGSGGFLGKKILRRLSQCGCGDVFRVGEFDRHDGAYGFYPASTLDSQILSESDTLILCGAQYYKGQNPELIAEMWRYNFEYTGDAIRKFAAEGGRNIVFFSSYMQLYDSAPYASDYLDTKRNILASIECDTRLTVLNLYIYDNWCGGDTRPKILPYLLKAEQTRSRFSVPSPDALIDICDSNALVESIVSQVIDFKGGARSLATGSPTTLREMVNTFCSREYVNNFVDFGVNLPSTAFLPYVDLVSIKKPN